MPTNSLMSCSEMKPSASRSIRLKALLYEQRSGLSVSHGDERFFPEGTRATHLRFTSSTTLRCMVAARNSTQWILPELSMLTA
eukprot:scaffold803_cov310-Pinguiococcus_pyrenoidosus.AAC.104